MELTQNELLILGRLTDDPELFALCQRIDADKEAFYLNQMCDESQALQVNPNLVIQYGAKASERKYGCRLYLDAAKTSARAHARAQLATSTG